MNKLNRRKPTKMKARVKLFSKKIFDSFLQGFLYIAPIGVTIYVIIQVFALLDGMVAHLIEEILGVKIPGLGIILMFLLITLLGYFGRYFISKPVKALIEKIISKAPLIEIIYTSIRDFISAFVGKEKKFTQPVLVKISKTSELEKIGFITESDLSELKIEGKVAVYFPLSYNFSGELFIVPKEMITPLDIPPAEAMKFVVSGGISKLQE